MADSPADVSLAWMVRVDLHTLAAHLTKRKKKRFDVIDAALWLCRVESPFTRTRAYAVFYIAEDPTVWLDKDEIVCVRETPRWIRRGGKLVPP